MLWLLTKIHRCLVTLNRKSIMGLQATLDQDKAALAATVEALHAAQANVDAANAAVARDQAALDALAPQLAAWDNLDAFVTANVTDDNMRVNLHGLISAGRASMGV